MQISSNEINSARTGPGIFNAINKQLGARLNLLYVCSHGTDAPLPLFGIGRVTWISRIEANDPIRPGTAAVDLRALAAPIGYGNNADPPGLVWIDACDSAGSGGGINNDFGDTFASGQLGYGVFLGWSGQCEQYGSQPPPNDAFDYWRRQLWHELFAAHRNFQTALSRTDTLTSNRGFGQLPPDHRPTVQKRWSGAGTTGF